MGASIVTKGSCLLNFHSEVRPAAPVSCPGIQRCSACSRAGSTFAGDQPLRSSPLHSYTTGAERFAYAPRMFIEVCSNHYALCASTAPRQRLFFMDGLSDRARRGLLLARFWVGARSAYREPHRSQALQRPHPQRAHDPTRGPANMQRMALPSIPPAQPTPLFFRTRLAAPAPPAQVVAPAAAQSAPPMPSLPDKPAPALPAAVQLAQTVHQSQTLVQPDAPKDLLLQHPTPIPLVMMWSQAAPPKTVPTPPQKAVVSNVRPSIALPNREQVPAEVRISSSNSTTALPTLAPGTTSPIVVLAGPDSGKADADNHLAIGADTNFRAHHLSLRSPRCSEGPGRSAALCKCQQRAHRHLAVPSLPASLKTPPTQATAAHPANSQPHRANTCKQATRQRASGAAAPLRPGCAGACAVFRGRHRHAESGFRHAHQPGQGRSVRRRCSRLVAHRPVPGDRRHLERPPGLHRLPARWHGQELDSAIFAAAEHAGRQHPGNTRPGSALALRHRRMPRHRPQRL